MFLAQNIIYLRKLKELTQEQLAHELGLKRTSVTNYEKESSTPEFETLLKLTSFFNVKLDDLVFKDLKKSSTQPLNKGQTDLESGTEINRSKAKGNKSIMEDRINSPKQLEVDNEIKKLKLRVSNLEKANKRINK